MGRILYSRILDKIEEADYDVFRCRAHTSQWEKLATALRLTVTDWRSLR
jgi:phytoene/squalene synthetase